MEERRKCEAEKVDAMQEQHGILEEQNRRIVDSMRREMQQEKSRALALQDNVLELKTVRWPTREFTASRESE